MFDNPVSLFVKCTIQASVPFLSAFSTVTSIPQEAGLWGGFILLLGRDWGRGEMFQSDLLWPGPQSHQPIIFSWPNKFWCKETIVVLQWAKLIDIKADRGECEAMTVEGEAEWGGRTKKPTPDLGQAEDFKVLRSWMGPPWGDELINNIPLFICRNFSISGSLLHYIRGFVFRIANVIL